MVEKWIQEVKIKKGALHRQLGYATGEKIPKYELQKYMRADIGETVDGKKVTRLLKRRVNLALNLRR